MKTTHTILKSRIPEIISTGDALVERAVAVTANNIVHLAMGSSRVATGNMRSGWQQDGGGKTRRVFNNVEYTVYNEYGTVYMSAQPMLQPAIEQELPEFQRRVREAYL